MAKFKVVAEVFYEVVCQTILEVERPECTNPDKIELTEQEKASIKANQELRRAMFPSGFWQIETYSVSGPL